MEKDNGYRNKPRHLRAVKPVAGPEQLTIEHGINQAIDAGRMTREIGKECLEAYARAFKLEPVPDPDLPPDAA